MADNVRLIREANALCACNADVATSMRDLANWIEANDYGDVLTVVALVESSDGELFRLTFGRPCDRTRVLGLLASMMGRMAVGTDK